MVPRQFCVNVQTGFPKTWDEVMKTLTNDPASQLQQLLNGEIHNRLFRADTIIHLPAKVLMK
ncbi:hypothetical protein GCM10011495_34700 [Hymenobacter frigidus]|uniref:Uncharacterized protein n=1 Tax=Hymenobacter frigidus TaxID=1524095 RepID=A0ABQ2AFP9_9BACT|nr:hypothetical protein GCM10011495_34700 [Hymenobacter frigidus]